MAPRVKTLEKDFERFPWGKVVCIAKAAVKFYVCWKSSGGDTCVKTLIADIEKCLKT
jgi:hypothetical protein